MLNKDNNKRYSIFDVAKVPCVNKKIQEFISQYDCKEEVMSYFDYDYKERNIADKNQKLIIKEPNRKQDKQHSNNDNNKLDFE